MKLQPGFHTLNVATREIGQGCFPGFFLECEAAVKQLGGSFKYF